MEKITKISQKKNLYCTLKSNGSAVGLISDEDMGNSEVGHNTLGSGQIYDQGAKLVDTSIKNGSLYRSKLWRKLTEKVISKKSTVHLIGLLSNGNVHSNFNQLLRITEGFAESGIQKLRLHLLTDGRDVP
ncbi:MAG: 2,3-bisphosphoglycerate-independent phosphoglycerate mutase, partial [Asgard group archaeon]|nr:2,3-bisphosphoglycerate-independent phosphoglycerate mutase [Asgard group archaeon]